MRCLFEGGEIQGRRYYISMGFIFLIYVDTNRLILFLMEILKMTVILLETWNLGTLYLLVKNYGICGIMLVMMIFHQLCDPNFLENYILKKNFVRNFCKNLSSRICLYSEKLWEKLLLTRSLHYRKPLLKTFGKKTFILNWSTSLVK